MNIGERLSERRKELGFTLEYVAKIVGVGKSTVRKWETGIIQNMRQDKIAKLAKALQVSPAYIMGWTDEKKEDTDSATEIEKSISSLLAERNIKLTNKDLSAIIKIVAAYISSKE
jgi:transcriptional regulator with XRE-family HTH domain